jgi:hypothetical protein
MDPKPHGISLGGPSKISGIQIDDLKSEEADARESRPHSRGDTPERPLRGSSSERAPAEPADLDKHDPRERSILVSLHDTILENFPVLLRKLAKGARESPKSASLKDRSTEVYTEPIRSNISDPTTASQYASLQGAFIRFSVWGKEFDVTSGALDKRLEYSDDLREDIILVLLQLCDALYQGKCTRKALTAKSHRRLTWNRSTASLKKWICHRSNRAAEYSANSRDCPVLRGR